MDSNNFTLCINRVSNRVLCALTGWNSLCSERWPWTHILLSLHKECYNHRHAPKLWLFYFKCYNFINIYNRLQLFSPSHCFLLVLSHSQWISPVSQSHFLLLSCYFFNCCSLSKVLIRVAYMNMDTLLFTRAPATSQWLFHWRKGIHDSLRKH